MNSRDKVILKKIVNYIDEINSFVKNYSFNDFMKDRKTISACAFSISQIGELSKEISESTQENNTDIPWKSMRGMRNRIVHDYENIDLIVLWKTITESLPDLKVRIERLL